MIPWEFLKKLCPVGAGSAAQGMQQAGEKGQHLEVFLSVHNSGICCQDKAGIYYKMGRLDMKTWATGFVWLFPIRFAAETVSVVPPGKTNSLSRL